MQSLRCARSPGAAAALDRAPSRQAVAQHGVPRRVFEFRAVSAPGLPERTSCAWWSMSVGGRLRLHALRNAGMLLAQELRHAASKKTTSVSDGVLGFGRT